MYTLIEFFRFLLRRKKSWLLPVLSTTALVSGLVVSNEERTEVAPSIYTLF